MAQLPKNLTEAKTMLLFNSLKIIYKKNVRNYSLKKSWYDLYLKKILQTIQGIFILYLIAIFELQFQKKNVNFRQLSSRKPVIRENYISLSIKVIIIKMFF